MNSSRAKLEEIVDRCRNGDQAAWHDLVDLVAPVIFSICRRMNLSRDESFDIYGQVCVVLVTNIQELNVTGRVISYAATVARRHIHESFRRARLFDSLRHEGLSTWHGTRESLPDRLYEATHRSQVLARTLLKLSERDYQLISALFLETDNPCYEDLAQRLNMPVSSIGPTRARVLDKLRRIMNRQGRASTRATNKPR